MNRTLAGTTNVVLGTAIAIFLVLLFVLTQKTYETLCRSNEEVIRTGNIISGYEKVAADFKNAIIYISTYKHSPSQEYLGTYGKGLWEIRMDMYNLKKLVSEPERAQLNHLAEQIYAEEDWLSAPGADDPDRYEERERHMQNIISIQNYLDKKIAALSQRSINNVKDTGQLLVRLHYWLIALIISTSAVIVLAFFLLRKQLNKVKAQNDAMVDIAWTQSHKVRAQLAVMLGLAQLFDHENACGEENGTVLNYMVTTAHKLDNIVKEINEKATSC